eukprot:TRINITY_DN7212_c0_g1_i1.p1 TRINITY_DN7212_c0_g1~~TRINITY_DN7212_c0_g1_i1.p1  ORF type:complete len:141 (-),score=23.37 TRINITY_DN7212_c0_g1_i1:76-447(-)
MQPFIEPSKHTGDSWKFGNSSVLLVLGKDQTFSYTRDDGEWSSIESCRWETNDTKISGTYTLHKDTPERWTLTLTETHHSRDHSYGTSEGKLEVQICTIHAEKDKPISVVIGKDTFPIKKNST